MAGSPDRHTPIAANRQDWNVPRSFRVGNCDADAHCGTQLSPHWYAQGGRVSEQLRPEEVRDMWARLDDARKSRIYGTPEAADLLNALHAAQDALYEVSSAIVRERGSVTQKVARLDSVACLVGGRDLVGPAEHGSGLGEVHDNVSVPVEDVADLADASTLGEAAVNVVDAPRRTGHVGRLIDPLIDGHTHILPNPISWIRLGDLVCRHFRDKSPAQTFDLTEIVGSDPRKVLSREVDRQRREGSPFSDTSVLLRELMAEPRSSTGTTVSVGSGTVYVDVRIPFTRRVICIDIGRHPSLGWRYKR